MYFPTICHINDLLPHLEGWDEFKVNERPWGTVVDYHYQDDETFNCPYRREARGIKFFPDGSVMARGLNKFFNKGEKPEMEENNTFGFLHYQEKVDGSLINAVYDALGNIRLATKGGITDVSMQAERELKLPVEFYELCHERMSWHITDFFEYTSPNNRIVVRYDKPELTYICSRDTITGKYIHDYAPFSTYVREVDTYHENEVGIEDVRRWEDKEGVIAVYQNGYREKIKADDYVLKHRVKDQITQEKNLLKVVLEDNVDDLVGILDEKDFEYVKEYAHNFHITMGANLVFLNTVIDKLEGWDRKDVAQYVSKNLDKVYLPIFWQIFDGEKGEDVYMDFVGKHLSSQTKIDNIRMLVGEFS